MTGSRAAAAYVCNARDLSTARCPAPVAAWHVMRDAVRGVLHGMLRGMTRPGVKIVLDRTDDYTCGACEQILTGDLREVYGHVHEMHGRQSFVFVERASGDDDPGWGDVD